MERREHQGRDLLEERGLGSAWRGKERGCSDIPQVSSVGGCQDGP